MSETKNQKNGSIKEHEGITPEAFAPPGTRPPLAPADRMKAMIEGSLEPPNEMAKFIVGRLQETIARGNEVRAQLQQVEAAKRQLEEEQTRLMGAAESYARDLRALDKPAKDPAPEVPTEAKVVDNGAHEEAP